MTKVNYRLHVEISPTIITKKVFEPYSRPATARDLNQFEVQVTGLNTQTGDVIYKNEGEPEKYKALGIPGLRVPLAETMRDEGILINRRLVIVNDLNSLD
jgi:hypothetical protein